jgi:tRNA(fMet)-specific endonuclease VapC
MAVRYLLDTNILSDLIKNPRGSVAQRIAGLPAADREALATSLVVAGELRYGAAKKGSALLTERVELILAALEVLPLEAETDRQYGRIRAELESRGVTIGGNDLWIAAHALALDAVIVTDNVAEFKRVSKLRVENWLERKRKF